MHPLEITHHGKPPNPEKWEKKTHTSEACQGSIPEFSYQATESQIEESPEFLTVK